jgi:hypothetical protein
VDQLDRQTNIEECIRAEHLERGTKVFWPDQFVAIGFGLHTDVLDALVELTKIGKLVARVQVRSDEGHVCWEGSPTEYDAAGPIVCTDLACQAELHTSSYPVMYFWIAERWLSAIANAEKKSPRIQLVSRR